MMLSNPGSSSNMRFVRKTITKMADKMAAANQFASVCCCGHSNLVIFNRISSKLHLWFASIQPWFKFEYEFFFRQTITKMATGYQFASVYCCGHSNLVIFNRISSKFLIWFASFKHWFRFGCGFCQTNDNQGGRQNGRHLSVCSHSNLVIL